MGTLRIGFGLAVLAFGCEAEPELDDGGDSTGSPQQEAPRECIAPDGLGSPASIEDAVALINALPKPTSLPCFLESLDRPLSIAATVSARSAQPSTGEENPRLFITRETMILSVLPEGPGAELLEFAVDVGDGLSVKAELEFPIEAEIAATDAYVQVLRNPGTSCGTCHDREQHWGTVEDVPVFASEALQYPAEDDVSPAYVGALAQTCDTAESPQRCAMLTAVFAHGDVVPQRLPELIRICRLLE